MRSCCLVIMQKLFSWRKTIPFRRELRENETRAEKIMWFNLRNRKLGGLKFYRQHGVGPYIVDFFNSETKTIIELDGDVHFAIDSQVKKDLDRTKWLNENGFKILRFNNVDIFNNLGGVLAEIYFNLTNHETSSSPSP